jgi:hypothetical protein
MTDPHSSERRQPPERHPNWQDSAVLCWWDLDASVGGYHRIGFRPHAEGGPMADVSLGFMAADRIYKRNQSLPLAAAELDGAGWVTAGCSYEFTDHGVWRFDEADVTGELHLRDFHAAIDFYPKAGQLAERVSSGHLEAGCAITGRLRLGDREYRVDGMGVRDRGWGIRYFEEILAHRWIVGTFGPEASVYVVSLLGSHGRIVDFGALVRGEELIPATDVDVVTFLERDGVSHRGGTARLVLATGEVVDIRAEVLQRGVISFMAGKVAVNDTMCRFHWGERVGIGNFEISNNPAAGPNPPLVAVNAVLDDGLHLLGAPA